MESLPFFNLYPWLVPSHDQQAEAFLSEYLDTVRPWVTIGLGQRVSGVLQSGFACFSSELVGAVKPTASGVVPFLWRVGIPTIASFNRLWITNESASCPPEDSYTVVIPHYDPGRDKHDDQSPLLRRVMVMTWMISFAAIDVAARCLRGPMKTDPSPVICRALVEELKQQLDESGFATEFAKAKEELHAHQISKSTAHAGKSRPLDEASKTRQQIKYQLRRSLVHQKFLLCGAPNSDERREQALRLWKLKRPDLGCYIPYEPQDQWMDWVCSRPQNASLLTCIIAATSTSQSAGGSGRIILRSLGLGAEAASLDNEQAQEALRVRLDKMAAGRARSAAFAKAQQARALKRWGTHLTIPGPAEIQTRTTTVTTTTAASTAVAEGSSAAAAAQSTAVAAVSQAASSAEATTTTVMPTYRELRLGAQAKKKCPFTPPSTISCELPLDSPGQGKEPPKWAARTKSYPIKPISEEDGIWLLEAWLDQQFSRQHNEVRFSWRDSACPFLSFPSWIAQQHPDHPWAGWWTATVEKQSNQTTEYLRGSIIALRGPLRTSRQYGVAGSMGKIWEFGGPRPDHELA
ncbi:hypothetical protein HDU90_000409 [Geranomyces variabilis]|nr:hypothetical protein HDU90_000409 [Geranomyces variabilis]